MAREKPQPMEINVARRRQVASWVGYLLLVGCVALLLVVVLARFTDAVWLAVMLVSFMLLYMGIMGWLAMRNIEGKR